MRPVGVNMILYTNIMYLMYKSQHFGEKWGGGPDTVDYEVDL